jgi:hypothetical protein
MNKLEIIKQIKSLLKFGELKFKDAKSGDNVVRVDGEDFETGVPLFIVTEDGAIPTEDGTYPLEEEGLILVVLNGLIDSIEKVEVETPVEETEVPEEFEAEEVVVAEEEATQAIEEIVAELVEKVLGMEEVIEEMLKMSNEVAKFSKIVEDKMDTFIKDTPADLEFKSVKSEFSKMVDEKKNKVEQSLESFRKLRSNK